MHYFENNTGTEPYITRHLQAIQMYDTRNGLETT